MFCHKSSTNIAINNCTTIDLFNSEDRYSPWNMTAPLCVHNLTTFGIANVWVQVLHSRDTSRPICDLSQIIATRQLNAFTVPSTHYVSNNCIYVRSHLFVVTDSIAIDLMTIRDWLFSQHRPPARRHQQSCHFFLLAVVIDCEQGWGQIRFIKYKYKYKYKNLDFSNTNTNTHILLNFDSNTNTNTSIQIQIPIRSNKYICRNCSDPK